MTAQSFRFFISLCLLTTALTAGSVPCKAQFDVLKKAGKVVKDVAIAQAILKPDQKGSPPPWKQLPKHTGPLKKLNVLEVEMKVPAVSLEEIIIPSAHDGPTPSGADEGITSGAPPSPREATLSIEITEKLIHKLKSLDRFVIRNERVLQSASHTKPVPSVQKPAPTGGNSQDTPDDAEDDTVEEEPADKPVSGTKDTRSTGASTQPTSLAIGPMSGAYSVRAIIVQCTVVKKGSEAGVVTDLLNGKVDQRNIEALLKLDLVVTDSLGNPIATTHLSGRANINSADIEIRKELGPLGVRFKRYPNGSSTLDKAINQVVDWAAFTVAQTLASPGCPWEGRILAVGEDSERLVYINAGLDCNIKAGDEFLLLRPGKVIADDQGNPLSRERDKLVGRCRIDSVEQLVATAVLIEDKGVQRGDIVRCVEVQTVPVGKGP